MVPPPKERFDAVKTLRVLVTPSLLAICLGLGFGTGCKPAKPDGTTPPGDEGGDDGGGKRAKRGKRGKKGGDGGGEGGGQPTEEELAAQCPAEVSDTPTSLFNNQVFIRAPKNVELVEQNPFFAATMSDFVSACEAMIDRMAVIVLEDVDPKEDLEAKTKVIFEKNGYVGGTFSKPEIKSDTEVRLTAEFPSDGKSPPAKVYSVIQRKFGKLFLVWYQAQPDQYPGVINSFRESANRLIVVPPEEEG